MQDIIQKYRKILEKPCPEPFKEYIEELLECISGMSERKAPEQKAGIFKKTLPHKVKGPDYAEIKDASETVPEAP